MYCATTECGQVLPCRTHVKVGRPNLAARVHRRVPWRVVEQQGAQQHHVAQVGLRAAQQRLQQPVEQLGGGVWGRGGRMCVEGNVADGGLCGLAAARAVEQLGGGVWGRGEQQVMQ